MSNWSHSNSAVLLHQKGISQYLYEGANKTPACVGKGSVCMSVWDGWRKEGREGGREGRSGATQMSVLIHVQKCGLEFVYVCLEGTGL